MCTDEREAVVVVATAAGGASVVVVAIAMNGVVVTSAGRVLMSTATAIILLHATVMLCTGSLSQSYRASPAIWSVTWITCLPTQVNAITPARLAST